ncbi:hypothetical protein CDAR_50891 [Caerostris darwini]|uniref:Uncharacterized protein n=1 Tax=Caerostris darwini TaxID=1538125 RepID=A0AAV4U5Z7_9ARAC|nr:hypothetical protein CDAR_50891 [Caerostris darwini]
MVLTYQFKLCIWLTNNLPRMQLKKPNCKANRNPKTIPKEKIEKSHPSPENPVTAYLSIDPATFLSAVLTHPVFTAGFSATAQDSRSVQKNCLSARRHTCVLQPYPAIRSNLVHGWQVPDKGHRTEMMMMYYSAARRFTLPER